MTFGLEKAPHRSLLYALGLTREEMKRPLIGVVNAANEVVPGHLHLGKIAEAVKAGIRMAGGTPMEFPAIAVCDGLAMNHEGMRFSLTSREVITDSIEIMATAHPFDALVFIPNCDKIVPGMLMAMMRLNLPSIIMSGGPMLAGRNNTDLISVFEGVGAVRNGTMTEEELEDLTENACPGCGSCSGMYTANTMNCLCEAMGVALPGNGTTPAVSAARIRLAKQAGMQVMELLEKNIRPRDIVTEQSVHNAVAADMALGGSTNTTLHLPAVFGEAELSLSLDIFDDISRKTPNICKLSPAGTQHIEDLHRAGGIPAVMGALLDKGLVHGEALTVTGKTVAENIKELKAHIIDPDVIRIDKPYAKEGVLELVKRRIPWLLMLMLSATFTGLIITHFENALAVCTALTAFIPMLMGTGGNSGSQASVAVIRSISLGEVEFKDLPWIVWKEIRVAVLCGVILAVCNFGKMLLVDRLLMQNPDITVTVALVVCVTLMFVVLAAKTIGACLPIVAKKIGLDPAVMASPFITTIVDALSLLIYFAVASVVLPI